jgi:hypothetical protein
MCRLRWNKHRISNCLLRRRYRIDVAYCQNPTQSEIRFDRRARSLGVSDEVRHEKWDRDAGQSLS